MLAHKAIHFLMLYSYMSYFVLIFSIPKAISLALSPLLAGCLHLQFFVLLLFEKKRHFIFNYLHVCMCVCLVACISQLGYQHVYYCPPCSCHFKAVMAQKLHVCSSSDISKRHNLIENFLLLWILQYLCPLFHNDPWALCARIVLQVYQMGLGSTLCIVISCSCL